jgi:hypothetical protein
MMPGQNIKICPMCSNSRPFTHLLGPLQISYWHCDICQLIFMNREYLPDGETEEQHYKTHQNGPPYPHPATTDQDQQPHAVTFPNQPFNQRSDYLN